MKANKTVIHIGMPKSASTTLQNQFFNRIKDINYFGYTVDKPSTQLFDVVFKLEESEYDFAKFDQTVRKSIVDDRLTIISSEWFCAPFYPYASGVPQDKAIIARRLKELFPEVDILIIIRNQFTLLQSLYIQILRNEKSVLNERNLSFNKWLDINKELHFKKWRNVFQFAEYYSLIQLYKSLFLNVKVIPFERLIKNFNHTVNTELCSFLELENNSKKFLISKENSRHTSGKISGERITQNLSLFAKDKLSWIYNNISADSKKRIEVAIQNVVSLVKSKDLNTEYSKENRDFIKDYYAESNQNLNSLINEDITKFEYPGTILSD